jgi:hypothetical protein
LFLNEKKRSSGGDGIDSEEAAAIGRTIRNRNGHSKVLATYSLSDKNLDTIRIEATSVPEAPTSASNLSQMYFNLQQTFLTLRLQNIDFEMT